MRFDYVLADPDKTFLNELAKYHVSGQLRVAPEHVSNQVLKYMGKPSHEVYEKFLKEFDKANKKVGLAVSLPFHILCPPHPGCTMKEAVKLAEYVRDLGFTPEQVQDFYPTPSTLSTCMYYTGIHPLTGEKIYVPKNTHEKAIQRALMQYKNPANRELVLEGLKIAGRMDLVGYGEKCLIRPVRKSTYDNKYERMPGVTEDQSMVRHQRKPSAIITQEKSRNRSVFMKLMQTNKGEFGYLKRERKRRIIIAAIMLGVPVFIFISMWIYLGTRNSIWTIIAW